MWYYVKNAQARGPIELLALQAMFKDGTLAPDTLVWKPDMPDWLPARSVPELAGSMPASGTRPPIPPLSLPPRNNASSLSEADKQDIEENRVFAVLAYINILFLVPLLAARHSKFARYHTNQGILLFIAVAILTFILNELRLPDMDVFFLPTKSLGSAIGFSFMIIGIIHAVSGECKPLPWIGRFKILT